MPVLRFSRDKRGYENTFVVHTARRRGKTRSRILYWFRTPPSVRVGRAALDEDAIRLIEENNPDVEFDWTRILKGQDSGDVKPKPEQERRPARPPRQRDTPAPPRPAAVETAPQPPAAPIEPEAEPDIAVTLPPGEPETAALARLGAEGLLRLRARHAEVLARISEKITDPERRDELKSQAERLNPDTWVTDGEVTAGLEQYEAVFESLRSVVGRRRKRRKRRSGGGQGSAQQPSTGATAQPDPSADADSGDPATDGDEQGDPDDKL